MAKNKKYGVLHESVHQLADAGVAVNEAIRIPFNSSRGRSMMRRLGIKVKRVPNYKKPKI